MASRNSHGSRISTQPMSHMRDSVRLRPGWTASNLRSKPVWPDVWRAACVPKPCVGAAEKSVGCGVPCWGVVHGVGLGVDWLSEGAGLLCEGSAEDAGAE